MIRIVATIILRAEAAAGIAVVAEAGEVAEAAKIVDPRRSAVGEIAEVYRQYPHIGAVLPAVGYHPSQLRALGETINATEADVVVAATTCRLDALMDINKPVVCARYEFAEAGEPGLGSLVEAFLKERQPDS